MFSYFIFLFIAIAVILESIFRILPTSDSLKLKPVTDADPILKYTENREVTKQIGFNFSHFNTKKINNYGYVTDKIFQKKSNKTKPVIAVIGDSYVEALQVKNTDTFHAILDNKFENYDFYPLGISGSPLSQYLAFAKFASNHFDPEVYIFLIIENDFEESFFNYKNQNGFHYFDEFGNLFSTTNTRSMIKEFLSKSAFLRFLYLDLKIHVQLERLSRQQISSQNNHINDVSEKQLESELYNAGMNAIDFFFKKVETITKNHDVIFLIDGDRSAIYRDLEVRSSLRRQKLMQYFLAKADQYQVIDLHPLFLDHWRRNKQKFNFDYDYHWNETGHSVAAIALNNALSMRFQR